MSSIMLLALFLFVGLIGLAYWMHRQERQYEKKSVKETLSPTVKKLIELEREENRQKKEHFETFLKQARRPGLGQSNLSETSSEESTE